MNYEAIITERNELNLFAKFLGITITEIQPGFAKTELHLREEHLNINGVVHGGCLFTIADVTGGAASISYGNNYATLDSSFHYLNPAFHTSIIYAQSKEIKRGKRVTVQNVTVTNQDGVLLAEGIFTYMTIRENQNLIPVKTAELNKE